MGTSKSEETKKKISEAHKGKPSKFKGKKYEEIMGEEKANKLKDLKRKKTLSQYYDSVMSRLEEMNLELLDKKYRGLKKEHNFKCKICGNGFKSKYGILKRRKTICNFCGSENPKRIK